MPITRTTITRAAGWTNADVITQLEEALAFAGQHGGPLTGLVAGAGYIADAATFGGTVGTTSTTYRDVQPTATSGDGKYATFNITRTGGRITFIRVNRPGSGYATGDTVTIPANSIGGAANGATSITFPVFVASAIAGGQTYTLTYSGDYVLSGTDRVGSFSNVSRTTARTITVMEGDRIVINNNNTSGGWNSISFLMEDNKFNGQSISPSNTVNEANNQTPVTVTWTTQASQAGTYYISSRTENSLPVAHNILVLPADGTRTFTPRSYGSSTTFLEKQASNPAAICPWGCLRQEVQADKRYGSTYRVFQVTSRTRLDFHVGSSFCPELLVENSLSNRFRGSQLLDLGQNVDTDDAVSFSDTVLRAYNNATSQLTSNNTPSFGQIGGGPLRTEIGPICDSNASNAFSLDLNVYRSSLDPKFSVLSYKQPNLSSTHLTSNSFLTFFLHNYTTSIWDLDNVFLSGLTVLLVNGGNTTNPAITFRTFCAGQLVDLYWGVSMRAAEAGYLPISDVGGSSRVRELGTFGGAKDTTYYANTYPVGRPEATLTSLYYRTNLTARGPGMPDASNFNAIIRGIPVSTSIVPVPYYLPDEFVLVMFDNATPSLNVQQGDTLIVEEDVEEYMIITGSYNQTTRTRGILFCARTV